MIATEHYNAQLEQQNWWFKTRRAYMERALRQVARKPSLVLDVGCGSGGNLPMLSQFGPVSGVDISTRALGMCDWRFQTMEADARDLPFADRSLDLVTCMDVLEHVEEDVMVASEAYRVLKHGGVYAVTVPAYQNMYSYHDAALGHRRRYEPAELRSLLESEGFYAERLHGMFGLLLPAAVLQRKWRREHRADDFAAMAGATNAAFTAITRIELAWTRLAPLPFGTSLLAVGVKE